MSEYSRKFGAHGARGIGIWLQMLTFLTYICIPVNIGIICYTGHKVKAHNVIGQPDQASFRKFLFQENWELWTPLMVLWLAVVAEHGLFFFKYAISLTIGDVPEEVLDAELIRPKLKEKARERMLEIKEANPDILSYEDQVRKTSKAVKKVNKMLVDSENN